MQLSRQQLYDLVCNTPLSKLAPKLDITVFALTALCKKHHVPYPGSGYWTKKSLGIEQVLEPLPALDGEESLITVEPSKPRRTARKASSPIEGGRANASGADETAAKPVKQHPLVTKWIANRERFRREALASGSEWRISNAPSPLAEIDYRRYAILASLFQALEAKGAVVSEGDNGLARVTIDGEKIDFQVREKNRQVTLSPTDRRSSYRSQELVGTGKLVFAIRTYLRGPHNEEWKESDRNPLESQVPKMVERLFEGAVILKAWHIEQEQDRLRWREEEERRAEQARLAEEEELRRKELGKLARNWRRANEIRAFIAEAKLHPFDAEASIHGKTLAEWLAWAETAAAALDKSREGWREYSRHSAT
jgi:hypothetical protein